MFTEAIERTAQTINTNFIVSSQKSLWIYYFETEIIIWYNLCTPQNTSNLYSIQLSNFNLYTKIATTTKNLEKKISGVLVISLIRLK